MGVGNSLTGVLLRASISTKDSNRGMLSFPAKFVLSFNSKVIEMFAKAAKSLFGCIKRFENFVVYCKLVS